MGVERIGQAQEIIAALVQHLRGDAAMIGQHIGQAGAAEILRGLPVGRQKGRDIEVKAVSDIGALRGISFDQQRIGDRQSVVYGMSVSLRVDLTCRRYLTKKKHTTLIL